MGKVKETARKSTGAPVARKVLSSSPSHSTGDADSPIEHESRSSPAEPITIGNSMNNYSHSNNVPKPKSSFPSIKPSPDVTPTELQIRQLELMEEQCDSLEKLVEIAAERRDIEKEILEIKKRKLALLEKNSKK